VAHVETRTRRRIHCPRCSVACEWTGNPHRPFCSLECRLIDLGAWLDERYRVPGPELSTDTESPGNGAPGGG
jgi:uncharacterized protein